MVGRLMLLLLVAGSSAQQVQQASDCRPGQFFDPVLTSCNNCGVRQYSDTVGALRCENCPPGTSTLGQGASSRTECITECAPGNFYDTNSRQCTECSIRQYSTSGINSATQIIRTFCENCPSDRPLTAGRGTTTSDHCAAQCADGQELMLRNNVVTCEDCAQNFFRSGTTLRCLACPEGYVTQGTGATSRTQCQRFCDRGTYLASADNCTACPTGQYQDLEGQSQCKPCPPGQNTLSTGSNNINQCIVECLPGLYLDSNNRCQQCPRGSYQTQTGLIQQCTSCNAGLTTAVAGTGTDNACIAICARGSTRNALTGACTLCPRNTYQILPDQLTCTDCLQGTVTLQQGSDSSSSCIAACVPGTRRLSTGVCERCPIGTYQSASEQTNCTQCPTGTTTRQDARTQATECVATCNKGSRIDGIQCTQCSRGFYQDEVEQNECKPCRTGLTTRSEGADNVNLCVLFCDPGKSPVAGQCQNCPIGTYKTAEGQDNCTACTNGRVTLNTGSTSELACVPVCPAGNYLNIALRSCSSCPQNQYQPNSGRTVCLSCGTDMINDAEGSTTQSDCYRNCSSGQRLANTPTNCLFCEIGYYQNVPGQRSCKKCDDPKTTLRTGAEAESECVVHCDLGYRENNGTCKKCPANSYQDARGQTSCIPCPQRTGTYNTEGSTSQADCRNICEPGNRLDGSTCVPCPRNEYQPDAGKLDCVRCSSGYETLQGGSTSSNDCLYQCPVGFEQDGDSEQCKPCDRGFYKDESILDRCKQCPNGFTTQGVQSTGILQCNQAVCSLGQKPYGAICINCPYNQYQDVEHQDACKSCPDDHVTTIEGAKSETDCIFSCPAGSEPVSATTKRCKNCAKGYYKEVVGTSSCIKCNSPFTTGTTGATSVLACNSRICPAGSYRNPSTNACILCGKGQYQDKADQTSCNKCPDGSSTVANTDGTFGAKSLSSCFSTNECDRNVHNCHANAVCANTPTGFECRCGPGFAGDGVRVCVHQCDEGNYCLNGGTCSRTDVGARCSCNSGYVGSRCQDKEDVTDDTWKYIVGGVFGGLGFLLLLALLILACFCACRRHGAKSEVTYVKQQPAAPVYGPPYASVAPAAPSVIVREIKQEPIVVNQTVTQNSQPALTSQSQNATLRSLANYQNPNYIPRDTQSNFNV